MINNNNIQEQQKDSLLPPPEILMKYQELGIGEDLLELVKAEQEHRHTLQNKYQVNYRMGQLFGFIICLLFICNIFRLIGDGYSIEAYILFGIFSLLLLTITLEVRSGKKATAKRASTTTRNRVAQRRNASKNYR